MLQRGGTQHLCLIRYRNVTIQYFIDFGLRKIIMDSVRCQEHRLKGNTCRQLLNDQRLQPFAVSASHATVDCLSAALTGEYSEMMIHKPLICGLIYRQLPSGQAVFCVKPCVADMGQIYGFFGKKQRCCRRPHQFVIGGLLRQLQQSVIDFNEKTLDIGGTLGSAAFTQLPGNKQGSFLSAGISADAIADTDPAWPLQLGCSRLIMNDKMSDQCRILTCLFAFSTLRTI